MNIIDDLSRNIIEISKLYDFQNREFTAPNEDKIGIHLGPSVSNRCAQEVFSDINNLFGLDWPGNTPVYRRLNGRVYEHDIDCELYIDIVLSNEEPKVRHFEGISIADIYNQTGEYINDPRLSERERELLDQIRKNILEGKRPPFEEYRDVSGLFKRYINDINRKWNSRGYDSIISAEFMEPYKLVIYMKAIAFEYDRNGLTMAEDYFAGTLAHELFHYFHFSSMFSRTKWDYKNHSCVPIESLASYYEYACLNGAGNQILASNLEDSWRAHDMDVWPYAGAKYILRYSSNESKYHNDNFFKHIFEDSLANMDVAYEGFVVCRKHEEDRDFFRYL